MEDVIKTTKTKNLILSFGIFIKDSIITIDTFYVSDLNIPDIIFKCHDLSTLIQWAAINAAYPREELQQIVGAAVMVITEQKLRYKNLIDSIFQNTDDKNNQ